MGKNSSKFFEFMHKKIWPQVDKFIDKNEEAAEEEFREGKIGCLIAYGDTGLAWYGRPKRLKHLLKNTIYELVAQRKLTKREVREALEDAFEEVDELADDEKLWRTVRDD